MTKANAVNTRKTKQHILPQMFDVRPVQSSGVLDWQKIKGVGKCTARPTEDTGSRIPVAPVFKPSVPQPEVRPKPQYIPQSLPQTIVQFGQVKPSSHIPVFHQASMAPKPKLKPSFSEEKSPVSRRDVFVAKVPERPIFPDPTLAYAPRSITLPHVAYAPERKISGRVPKKRNWTAPVLAGYRQLRETFSFVAKKKFAFASVSLVLILAGTFESFSLYQRGMSMKGRVLGVSQEGYANLNAAAESIESRRFDASAMQFDQAYQSFSEASKSFDEWNSTLVDLSRFLPFLSKLSSGKNVVEAGKHIALAGGYMNETLSALSNVKNPLAPESKDVSLLDLFQGTQSSVRAAKEELMAAQEALSKVDADDVPEDKRDRFIKVKNQLPDMIAVMDGFLEHGHIFNELLGGNGPRKYLFLFQNNHEMRATGGFIGSYGLLDISNGHIRNFFVDGIFNPDGQLKEDIVPPTPIQKVSAGWSLHDSNWFPDFPTSAEKAVSFYEKTGGPTVDGVITLTPEVMERLLSVTGPIAMEKYGVVLNADNFIPMVQTEVEMNYDKQENKPKQILADLAPLLLEKLFNVESADQIVKTVQAFESGLREKHILLYSRNSDVERLIDDQGWSGKIVDASKDYLSVINTNINGYKTDGVIEESIEHEASIQENGSILDTVTITRKHHGGNTDQEWWNKVNADYMRVYVPQGSKLLSVEGQTRETVQPPLDYDALGFKRDADIEKEERNMVIDPKSGTRIYDESGKTVFGNWVYVSPQETVAIRYTYLLPFTIRPESQEKDGLDSYSVVFQKQPGSLGSRLQSTLTFPARMQSVWQSSENLLPYDGGLRFEKDLKTDQFMGVVFRNQ